MEKGEHYSENMITDFYKTENKPNRNRFRTAHPEITKATLIL